MTPTELFQNKHGARWATIAQGPELTDALLTVGTPILDEIVRLTPTDIRDSGSIILARLQGQLLHERALVDLSVVKPNITDDLPAATYPNPEDEAEEQADQQDQQTGGSIQEWFAPSPSTEEPAKLNPSVVKPKQKRKRRRKRKQNAS